jgi:hypothetical protein
LDGRGGHLDHKKEMIMKYSVRVVRTVEFVADIDVEAVNEVEAKAAAVDFANISEDIDWSEREVSDISACPLSSVDII